MPTNPAGGDSGTPPISGADVVAYAQQFLGVPYVWGGTSPTGVDCSGLVQLVYKHFGITTPRTTYDMVAPSSFLQRIDKSQLSAGDLLTSQWPGEDRPASHVAIYAGNGNVIEAPKPGGVVQVTKLNDYYWNHIDGVLHVPGVAGGSAGTPGGPGVVGTIESIAGGVAGSVLGPLVGWIPSPKNLTDAVTNVGTAAGSIAGSAAAAGHFAGLLTRALMPSNLLRGALLGMGTIFILIGIFFLAKEVSDS